MAIKLPPIPQNLLSNEFIWREWFQKIQNILGGIVGTIPWFSLDFTGSNITDIVTRHHNDLQNFQGGATNDYYHLTNTELKRMKSNQVLTWLSM